MPGFIVFHSSYRSGQNIQPPATLNKIKVEVEIKTAAKSKISCHVLRIKKPRSLRA